MVERDFLMIIECLSLNPESLPLLVNALDHFNGENRAEEQRKATLAEIARCRQRAKNADLMFSKARMSQEDWLHAQSETEAEIERLKTQVVEQHEAEVALKLTTDMVANLVENWKQANGEMHRALAHGLFEQIVYDLDAQRIVDFKLKPWAQLLMQLKITFDKGISDNKKPSASGENERVVWCGWGDSNPRPSAP